MPSNPSRRFTCMFESSGLRAQPPGCATRDRRNAKRRMTRAGPAYCSGIPTPPSSSWKAAQLRDLRFCRNSLSQDMARNQRAVRGRIGQRHPVPEYILEVREVNTVGGERLAASRVHGLHSGSFASPLWFPVSGDEHPEEEDGSE